MAVGEVVDAEGEFVPILPALQGQVIAGVQAEVGRELEVVGVGGVVGFLGLPPVFGAEGMPSRKPTASSMLSHVIMGRPPVNLPLLIVPLLLFR